MAKKNKANKLREQRAQQEARRKNRGQMAANKNRQKQLQGKDNNTQVKVQKNTLTTAVSKSVTPKVTWKPEENIKPLTAQYQTAAKEKEIAFGEPITVCVQLLSPIHLGSGQADVNVDAEVIHDDVGLPYFPAKRFKGLLYESALEVAEMSELSGLNLLQKAELNELFQHGCEGKTQLVVSNLCLPDYEQMHEEWQSFEQNFPSVFQPLDVLEQYTSLRYQTKIDAETGTAADTSLHNMRVVEEGLSFTGELEVIPGSCHAFEILALALRNLSQAGLKRTRGFGHIACTMEQNGRDILLPLVKNVLAKGGR